MSVIVKVCGCRPHDGGGAHTGAGVRKPPREETAGCRARCCVRRYGDLTAVVPECEYNFCDMARTLRMGENAFRHPCNFKELRVVKKGTYYSLCVMCLMAAFVPHRPNKYFHVSASNGIVRVRLIHPSRSWLHLQAHRFRYSKLSAMQMSPRYVRFAPNVVDDITRDHHADRSSVLGTCFWPLIVR